jgi:hypothetical protein
MPGAFFHVLLASRSDACGAAAILPRFCNVVFSDFAKCRQESQIFAEKNICNLFHRLFANATGLVCQRKSGLRHSIFNLQERRAAGCTVWSACRTGSG